MNWNALLSASDNEYRMRNISELGLTLMVAFLVIMVGILPATEAMVRRAEVSEALMLTSTQRVEMATERAYSGSWSASRESMRRDSPTDTSGNFVKSVDWSDGLLAVQLRTEIESSETEMLYFRPATNASDPAAPMLWVCGNWKTPVGFETRPGPSTNISPKYLPHVCRDLTTTFVP